MSKKIDWTKINYRGPLGKQGATSTMYRDKVQKGIENYQAQQDAIKRLKELESPLKKCLLERMVNRTPIKVLKPISNLTETLIKSDFGNSRFEITPQTIQPGTHLVFVAHDRQLGQFIFKDQHGQEVCIYDAPYINVAPNQASKNHALDGLLYNTDIFQEVTNEG